MTALRKSALFGTLKNEFLEDKVLFLEYIVSKDGISVYDSKVEAIKQWPISRSLFEIRCFHGLAVFYRHFILHFSTRKHLS